MTETETPPEGTETPPPPGEIPDDVAVLKAELAKVRKEAAGYRTRAKELEDRDKSELQKLQDTLTEKDAQLASLPKTVRGQVLRFASAATSKGFLDPEDALAFIDSDIDLADKAAVETALDELAERKPHLVKAKRQMPAKPKPSGGDGNPDSDPDPGSLSGKERAAAALRQMRTTR